MKLLMKEKGRFPVGVWFALIALVLILLAWLMQSYSLLNWENAVKIGAQDVSFTGGAVERAIADVEKAVAIADIIWAFPLTIIAFIGLWKKQYFGFISAMMVYAICVYFPLIYTFREGTSTDIKLTALFLWAIPSLLGIICLWANRAIFEREIRS